jgi:hypothetical protein
MKVSKPAIAAWILMGLAATGSARGNVALLIEEPYGLFGGVNPTGHSAIYLNRVCAESPTVLRRCGPGEAGVVISRYSGIRKLDWVAIPLLPYLYAVERVEDVPEWAAKTDVTRMRDQYAEAHLGDLTSTTQGDDRKNVWPQLLGVAYTRKIYSLEVETDEEQDDNLIAEFNSHGNNSHFNLFTKNCADFSRTVLNFYFPGAVHRSITADVGITTPKQIAKAFAGYAHHHEALEFRKFAIPQVPGDTRRSHMPRGVLESLVKTKGYVVPIAVLQPYVMVGIAATYLINGRFDLSKNSPVIPVMDQVSTLVSGKPSDRLVASKPEDVAPTMP